MLGSSKTFRCCLVSVLAAAITSCGGNGESVGNRVLSKPPNSVGSSFEAMGEVKNVTIGYLLSREVCYWGVESGRVYFRIEKYEVKSTDGMPRKLPDEIVAVEAANLVISEDVDPGDVIWINDGRVCPIRERPVIRKVVK
jgi:hypothetical protein